MPSILPGYEYDIFISYRQKDNEYDSWVTQLVDHLHKEIKATFKEDISIYFDSNPFDGLVETNDVDLSLREKIKCLIFIPVVSQTYCDPKCFAWKNEFLAFIDFARQDKFGLDIRLKNGNVTKRILPIKIHDIDEDDVALFESEIGGNMRPVEFIYKSAGVNRPLRAREEHPEGNIQRIFYRDQINKVANAVKDIISSLKDPDVLADESNNPEIGVINERNTESNSETSITAPRTPGKLHKLAIYSLGSILFLTVGFFIIKWLNQQSRINYANETLLPEIAAIIDSTGITWEAVSLIDDANKWIPDNPILNRYTNELPRIAITSQPSGADVYGRDYKDVQGEWKYLGKTPLSEAGIPSSSSQFKFELTGYQSAVIPLFAPPWLFKDVSVRLFPADESPEGMVFIQGDSFQISLVGFDHLPKKQIGDFWIDKYEVTNKEFKQFVDQGGYKEPKYWKHPILDNGKELEFQQAMALFKDKTGLMGPAGWEAGSYPDGQGDYPVGGISWYEAAAYAVFIGKSLPSIYHWNMVALTRSSGDVVPLGNMRNNEPRAVGESVSLNIGGAYDLAGNVREWVFNRESKTGDRFILGGGWDDAAYAFTDAYSLPPLNRSLTNGIRCMIPGDDSKPDDLMLVLENPSRDFRREKPIGDSMFEMLTRQYDYDKGELAPEILLTDSTHEYWIRQKVEINAAYGNERIPLYLYFPKNSQPPFQTVVMFPGDGGFHNPSSSSMNIPDYYIKSGRALVIPVYKSLYERQDDLNSSMPNLTVQYKEHVIMWSKDLRRTVDYLETRNEIDIEKLAYNGFSWGGRLGPIMMYTEKRFKAGILYVAGLRSQRCMAEVDPFNFVPRVKIPVLMLNGEYDFYFPVETSQRPMFDNFGTPVEHKSWKIYDGSHHVPRTELVKESIAWLDRYLGSIK